jgi:hypothetical protein
LGELDGVVARIEEEPGQPALSWQVGKEGRDLLGGEHIGILLRAQPPYAQGRCPALAGETELRNPRIRPAGDDGLAGGMARGMVVDGPFGAGLGVAARPDTHIDSIDRFAAGQGVADEQLLQAAGAELPNRQGVLEAAPAAPMLRLHAEQRQRRDGAGRQQGVAQFEEGVLPSTEGGIRRGAEAGKRGKGIHVVQFGTY